MKLTIFIVAIISAAMIAVAVMLSFNPNSDFKSDLDDIPIATEKGWDFDLYIETTTADYWERVRGLKKKKETSAETTDADVFITDKNGKIVTDENGEPETSKKYENVTDENGEIVTDENGDPVAETNDENDTDESSSDVTDKHGNPVTDNTEENDKNASVTDVPKNNKSNSKVTKTAH